MSNTLHQTAEELPGGAIRVTTRQSDTPANESTHPEFQGQGVVNGGVSITGNGVSHIGALTSLNSSDLAVNPSGSILGTARNNGGFRPNVIGMDHTVEIIPGNPASRTSVKAAITQGYLTSDVHGNVTETSASPASPSPARAEPMPAHNAQTETGAERFNNPEAEALMNHAAHGIPESVFTAELTKAATGGQPDLQRLANMSGKSVEEMNWIVTGLRASFHGQAQRAAIESGVADEDFDNFSAWARDNRADAFKNAQLQHVNGRSTQGIRALAREYLTHSAPSSDAIKAAGLQTWTDPISKQEMVKIGGFTISVVAATRAGLL